MMAVLWHFFVAQHFWHDLPLKLTTEGEEEAMISVKGAHSQKHFILTCVRWYVAHLKLSPTGRADTGAWRLRRPRHDPPPGPPVDAPSWGAFHRRKRPVEVSWRMDAPHIRVK